MLFIIIFYTRFYSPSNPKIIINLPAPLKSVAGLSP